MNEKFFCKKFQKKIFGGKVVDKLKVRREIVSKKKIGQIREVKISGNIHLLISIGFQMHLTKIKKILPNIYARSTKICNL